MYFRQTYLLFSVGASLIGSNCPWYFKIFPFFHPVNINSFEAEEVEIPSGVTPLSNEYKSKNSTDNGGKTVVYLTEEKSNRSYYLYRPNEDLRDFGLHFSATEANYEGVSVEDISISLFTSPAWNSESGKDEYSTNLTKQQINDLFGNAHHTKTKQLLLSLSIKHDWSFLVDKTTFWSSHFAHRPKSVEELKNLKIKHFRDYDSLKTYVKKKVEGCTNIKKSCVARDGELEFMKQDKLDFY